MSMDSTVYDKLKWLALVLLPAVALLLSAIGDIYGWPDVDLYVATINAIAVFLGSILQISSRDYHHKGGKNGR